MTLTLTERDMDLLDVLTLRVRLLTLRQVTELWWPTGENQRCARRRLECLVSAKLIQMHCVNAHPLLPVTSALFAWEPGDAEPDCEQLAARCSQRWNRPAVPMTVFVAAPASANLLGSSACGLPHRDHWNHDLRLAAVYTAYRLQRPGLAAMWIGEHGLPKAGHRIKDPDAFLRHQSGQIVRVIESAGRYGESQFQSFHEHCEAHDLPYELW
jgi:hypothetical protein